MNDNKKLLDDFYNKIVGEWEHEFEKEIIRISIFDIFSKGRLIQVLDGKEDKNIEFIVPHDWYGKFMVEGIYCIEYNNLENILIFGELKDTRYPGIFKWRYSFKRIIKA